MGLALSYVRFKNGFIWGIALHCLINSVATTLAFNYPQAKKIQHIEKPAITKINFICVFVSPFARCFKFPQPAK